MDRPKLDPKDALALERPVDFEAELGRLARWRARGRVLTIAAPEAIDGAFDRRLPVEGAPLDAVLDELDKVAPAFARNNAHPGFFGYVCGPGLPTDPLASAIGAALNQNVTGFPSAPGATAIERTAIAWLAEVVGLPAEAGGSFVSGGSLANLTALAAAVRATYGEGHRERGLAAAVAERGAPRVYRAKTAHFSVERAAWTIGLGASALVDVPVDAARRLDPAALDAAIERDVAAGHAPVAVVATAGTTSTGAIDPLAAIADVCARHGVWMHVDGAYGAAGLFAPDLRPKFAGIERADSVTFDLHKWLYVALDASALLFRSPTRATAAFHAQADYTSLPRDGGPAEFAFYHLGPELSRRFRALPAWLALRHYGVRRIGANVSHNAACARYLAERCHAEEQLELVAAPELSIACFRYAPTMLRGDGERLDAVNEAIRERLIAEDVAFLSATTLDGRAVLRVCISNHATDADAIDRLVDAVIRMGGEVVGHA